ncbi:TPA: hypothetical protein EYN65_15615 [Candidatus Poribacteria bacterium]|nr:hypothetical protein [Candidatus Poribacteria bacterium]HIB89401.1 hypothetical protein [Candidatus Poribacteria bacterium]
MVKLKNVNTTDIGEAIRLGCQTMCSVFNADDNDIPFFGSQVQPEAALRFSAYHSEAHVPGRHLNALLNAEDAIGIELEEDGVEKHARAAFLSYSGPVPLPLNRETIDGHLVNFIPHNVREGFHALYSLVKYRHLRKARDLAEASICTIFAYWDATRGWNRQRLSQEHGLKLPGPDSPFTEGGTFITALARAIGPLVKYYRAARYAPALDLAIVLKEKAIDGYFTQDGQYNREELGAHTHSTTCVMSSLAQLADLTVDSHLMNRVKAFYDNGLWEIRDALGWVIESSHEDASPDRGEVNNTGDILETALILGRWGYVEYYEDAERILRGHLLPSQLRDTSFIQDPPNPDGIDGRRNVAARHLGAFGFPAPYGHHPLESAQVSFNMDIVGGTVGSLCEAYRAVARLDEAGHWVNLLFDHETDAIQVKSPYTMPTLSIRVKQAAPLFVRIPSWVKPESIKLQGTSESLRLTNGYLFIAQPPINRVLTIDFPLPEQEIVLKHRTREIHARLRGDEVMAMENFGAPLTFFPQYQIQTL